MSASFGKFIKLNIGGTSRSESVTASLSGFPAGFTIDRDNLTSFLERRAPGRSALTSSRREADVPEFVSGIEGNTTNGGTINIVIKNTDAAKSDSIDYRVTPRPGHADYPALIKYGKDVDIRGGGRFSGRLTAPFCVAGGLALQYLESLGIKVTGHLCTVGRVVDTETDLLKPDIETLEKRINNGQLPVCSDKAFNDMMNAVKTAKDTGDSLGGTVECYVTGVLPGLGEHMFASCEKSISDAVFAIPGVKGIEFGYGFASSFISGSENNDGYRFADGKVVFESNNAGGILGGMTTGAPLCFRVAFKPTPSISKEQHTVNMSTHENTDISVNGRNDPAYVLRAVPCVEAAAALAVLDLILQSKPNPATLEECRAAIDNADRDIADAFERRMQAVKSISEIKKGSDSPIYVQARENKVLANVTESTCFKAETEELYKGIFRVSREFQGKTSPRLRGFEDKKIYLIGNPLGHSFSPLVHSFIGDYSYELKNLAQDELHRFFTEKQFDGLNVTIPYKKTVIKYMDELSPEAEATGAVNTVVKTENGRLKGYNTDVYGVEESIRKLFPRGGPCKAVILGDGGAAAAVRYVLEKLGTGDIYTVTRKGDKTLGFEDINAGLLTGALLINCTPIGMFPVESSLPFDAELVRNTAAVFDLVYNPLRTELLLAAEKYGIPHEGGLYMLVSQALVSAEIFTETEVSYKNAADSICRRVADIERNTVLIGMPGCGKSTVGRRISEITGKRFFDTDTDIYERTGFTPAEYITRFGESAFRDEETRSVITASHLRGAVIATGGGAVLRSENRRRLRASGRVFFIERELDVLESAGRPITAACGFEKLYNERYPLYKECADIIIRNNGIDETAESIINERQDEK